MLQYYGGYTGTPSASPPPTAIDLLLASTAWVAENGNDGTGEVNNLGKPFATIQAAVNAVGVNGTVWVFPKPLPYNEPVTIAKPLTLYFSPGVRKAQVNRIESAGIKIIAWGASTGNFIGADGYSYEIWGGNTDGVRVSGGTLKALGCFASDVTANNGGVLDFKLCEGTRIILGQNATLLADTCKFSYDLAATIQGSTFGAKIEAKNSTFISPTGRVIDGFSTGTDAFRGSLLLDNCELISEDSEPIRFAQTLAGKNKIVNCTLVGVGTNCIDFTGNATFSKLVFDSNRSNLAIPANTQIIAGNNFVNADIQ